MALKLNLKGGDSLMVAGSRFTIAGDGRASFLEEIGALAEKASAKDKEAISEILACFAQAKPFRAIKLARQFADRQNTSAT